VGAIAFVLAVAAAGLVARSLLPGLLLLLAGLAEVTLYRLGTLAAPRDRPAVVRLDDLPVGRSFPSGHVAARTVVYVAVALVLARGLPRRAATAC
jgi:membrane-associated phospholipid phosphatase